jgi:hypothetical protein
LSTKIPWFFHLRHEKLNVSEEVWSTAVLKSSRRVARLTISQCSDWDSNNLLEICKKNGSTIVELRIIQSEVYNSRIFLEIFKAMPNLKRVILLKVTIMETYVDPDVIDDLLETLEMIDTNNHILKCFRTSRLSTFKLSGSGSESEPVEPLLDYLTLQKNLKTLALRDINTKNSQLFRSPVDDDDIPFRLKKLSLFGIRLQQKPNDYSHLLKFLHLHAKTLHFLEIGQIFPKFIFEFIFSKFTHLHILKVEIDGIPTGLRLYERLANNTSVTKLILKEGADNPALSAFMRRLPNVETFENESWSEFPLQFLSTNFLRLRNLKIYQLSPQDINVRLPYVEKLHIENIDYDNNWVNFVAKNPNIKEMIIQGWRLNNLIGFNVDLKLQILIIDKTYNLSEDFCQSIHDHCRDLKVLRIYQEPSTIVGSKKIENILSTNALSFYDKLDMRFPIFKDEETWKKEDYDDKLPRCFVESLTEDSSDSDPDVDEISNDSDGETSDE